MRSPSGAGGRGWRTRSSWPSQRLCPFNARSLLDRLVDRGVAGAPAEVATDRLCHLHARRMRRRVEQCPRRHQHPRRAVPALRGAFLGERDLQRIELRSFREALDGGDFRVADPQREREAGEDRLAVEEHRARPALRSEEHTSELQSRENLVCRLLLEKKKKKK